MKTVNTIIERLRKEHGDNGCYYLFTHFVEVFEKSIADSKAAFGADSWLFLNGRVDEKHSCLDGFLWGLRAADLIADNERERAQDEIKALRWPENEEAAPAATETTSNASTTVNVSPDAPDVKGGADDAGS